MTNTTETNNSQVNSVIAKCQKIVYQNRIRIKEFFIDFDRLRCGEIYPNQFISALGIAGIDKYLNNIELNLIKIAYTSKIPKNGGPPGMINYKQFVDDIDSVFTIKNLELNPLLDVKLEPENLLNKDRYLRPGRSLSQNEEIELNLILNKISNYCQQRGMLIQSAFKDYSESCKKLVGHVTKSQFHQCLNVKLGFVDLSKKEIDLLCKKFKNEDRDEMVNYIAFSNIVDPCDPFYDPYRT